MITINEKFLKGLKPLWKYIFSDHINVLKAFQDHIKFKNRTKLVFQKNGWKMQTYINPY